MTLAEAIVNGPAHVFFKYLSYPKMIANKIDDITSVGIPTIKDKVSAKNEKMVTRAIAIFLEIFPDGRGLYGLSFLSILKSQRSLSMIPTQ
jgi:hypothetical protein